VWKPVLRTESRVGLQGADPLCSVPSGDGSRPPFARQLPTRVVEAECLGLLRLGHRTGTTRGEERGQDIRKAQ